MGNLRPPATASEVHAPVAAGVVRANTIEVFGVLLAGRRSQMRVANAFAVPADVVDVPIRGEPVLGFESVPMHSDSLSSDVEHSVPIRPDRACPIPAIAGLVDLLPEAIRFGLLRAVCRSGLLEALQVHLTEASTVVCSVAISSGTGMLSHVELLTQFGHAPGPLQRSRELLKLYSHYTERHGHKGAYAACRPWRSEQAA